MGLPSLTLNDDLAARWSALLEENGLTVRRDGTEGNHIERDVASKRVSEVLWRVCNSNAELKLLEGKFQDQDDRRVVLIFMPIETAAQRQLLSLVEGVLVASGATVGASHRSAK